MAPAPVRVLGHADHAQVVSLLNRDPVANVFVASRVRVSGVEPLLLGCELLGYFDEQGRLESMLHHGANLVPVSATERALDAFADRLGPHRRCASIVGVSQEAMGLWDRLSRRWPEGWKVARETRPVQPVMVIDTEPTVAGEPRVQRIGAEYLDPYFTAAVAMYTEEVGVSPLDGSGGYRYYVQRLIEQGRALGIVGEGGRVVFKADIGAATSTVCQVAGVWLDPALRGKGLSAAAMASVVTLCRRQWPTVSLYVNDYNVRAVKLYERVGFRRVGTFSTILY